MKEEKEIYEELLQKGHLSKGGLRHYIALLKGQIIDYSEDIKEVCKYKGLTTKDENA